MIIAGSTSPSTTPPSSAGGPGRWRATTSSGFTSASRGRLHHPGRRDLDRERAARRGRDWQGVAAQPTSLLLPPLSRRPPHNLLLRRHHHPVGLMLLGRPRRRSVFHPPTISGIMDGQPGPRAAHPHRPRAGRASFTPAPSDLAAAGHHVASAASSAHACRLSDFCWSNGDRFVWPAAASVDVLIQSSSDAAC